MALTLSGVRSFDVAPTGATSRTVLNQFKFKVTGDLSWSSVRLLICNNNTGALCVIATQTTSAKTFDFTKYMNDTAIIPLVNGTYYKVAVQVLDSGTSGWTDVSNYMQFYCLTTPTFAFTTIPSAIDAGEYTFTINYNQAQSDILTACTFYLYKGSNSVPIDTVSINPIPTTVPVSLSYTYSNFENSTTYSIECKGETWGGSATTTGFALNTGKTSFTIHQRAVTVTGTIKPTNNSCDGYVNLLVTPDSSVISTVEKIRVKRQMNVLNPNSWTTLFEVPVSSVVPNRNFQDYYAANGISYQYGFCGVTSSGIESTLVTEYTDDDNVSQEAIVVSHFDGIFIVDINNSYKFKAKVAYGTTTSKQKVGVLEPIGSVYPKIIRNGKTNYFEGSATGLILDANYYDDTGTHNTLNRGEIVRTVHEINTFLKNGNNKILKDWNGNITLCHVTGEPTFEYDANYGMGAVTGGFNWTQIGDANIISDLKNSNMLVRATASTIVVTAPSGTSVTLTSSATGQRLNGTTSSDGLYTVSTYVTGAYTITATYNGQQYNNTFEVIEGEVVNVEVPTGSLTVTTPTDLLTTLSNENLTLNIGGMGTDRNINSSSMTIYTILPNTYNLTAKISGSGASELIGQSQSLGSVLVNSAGGTVTIQNYGTVHFTNYVNALGATSATNSNVTINGGNANIRVFSSGSYTVNFGGSSTFMGTPSSATAKTTSVTYDTITNVAFEYATINLTSNFASSPTLDEEYVGALINISMNNKQQTMTITSNRSVYGLTGTYTSTWMAYRSVGLVSTAFTSSKTIDVNSLNTYTDNEIFPQYIWNIGNGTDTNTNAVSAGIYTDTDNNGLLSVVGSGKNTQYSDTNKPPWYNSYRQLIKSYNISSSVYFYPQYFFADNTNLVTGNDFAGHCYCYADYVFYGCSSLTQVPITLDSYWFISLASAFYNCSSLTSVGNIYLDDAIDTSVEQTDMTQTFRYCSNLSTIGTLKGVTNMDFTFARCTSLTTAPTIPSGVTNMDYTFASCTSLTTAPTTPSGVTSMNYTFADCTSLTGRIIVRANPPVYGGCFYRDIAGSTLYVDYTSNVTNINNIIATKGNGAIYKGNLVT